MGYRINSKPPKPKRRDLQATSTPGNIYMHNGTVSEFALPCMYRVIDSPAPAHHHDRAIHDHVGWPSPNHPDHVCQEWDFADSCCRGGRHDCTAGRGGGTCRRYVDIGSLSPIHFSEEGYEDFTVHIDPWRKGDSLDGVSAVARLDSEDDWIVRVEMSAAIADMYDPVELRYSVFADRDLITIGKLTVLPAAYKE